MSLPPRAKKARRSGCRLMARVRAEGRVAACDRQRIAWRGVAQWRQPGDQYAVEAAAPVLQRLAAPAGRQIDLKLDRLGRRIARRDAAQYPAVLRHRPRHCVTVHRLGRGGNQGRGGHRGGAAGQTDRRSRNRLAGKRRACGGRVFRRRRRAARGDSQNDRKARGTAPQLQSHISARSAALQECATPYCRPPLWRRSRLRHVNRIWS